MEDAITHYPFEAGFDKLVDGLLDPVPVGALIFQHHARNEILFSKVSNLIVMKIEKSRKKMPQGFFAVLKYCAEHVVISQTVSDRTGGDQVKPAYSPVEPVRYARRPGRHVYYIVF